MSLLTPRTDFVEARTSAFQSIHNLRINGNFDFWQRGTSFTSVTNGLYTADRWRYQKLGTASLQNITQDTDVPTVTQSGFQSLYSMLITQSATTDVTVDAGDLLGIGQRMEGQDYVNLHGGKGREQFWIKASIAGVYPIAFRNSASNRSYVTTFTVAAANTWQKITIDIALDSSGTWLFDNGIGLVMNIGLMVGSTYQTATQGSWVAGEFYAPSGVTLVNVAGTSGATIRLAQSSCIPGDFVATSGVVADLPFRRAGRTIGGELNMCQRFFETSYSTGVAPGSAADTANGWLLCNVTPAALSNAYVATSFTLKVTKRTTPTAIIYDMLGAANKYSFVNIGAPQTHGLTLGFVTATANSCIIGINTAYSQLGLNYTFDSEL